MMKSALEEYVREIVKSWRESKAIHAKIRA